MLWFGLVFKREVIKVYFHVTVPIFHHLVPSPIYRLVTIYEEKALRASVITFETFV